MCWASQGTEIRNEQLSGTEGDTCFVLQTTDSLISVQTLPLLLLTQQCLIPILSSSLNPSSKSLERETDRPQSGQLFNHDPISHGYGGLREKHTE